MKWTPLIAFLLIVCICEAQDIRQWVIPVQGDRAILDNMTVSWTLGEIITSSEQVAETVYTQGFQQPFFRIEPVSNSRTQNLNVRIYPNPTEGILYIALDRAPLHEISYEFYNSEGRLVKKTKSAGSLCEFNVSAFAQGQYILVIRDPVESMQSSYSIIKP